VKVYESWLEDTHDRFMFLFEGAHQEEIPLPLSGRALALAREDSRLLWFDRDTSLKALAEQLAARHDRPLYLLSGDGDLAQLERVRTLLELMGL
jgi:hypothetical protein